MHALRGQTLSGVAIQVSLEAGPKLQRYVEAVYSRAPLNEQQTPLSARQEESVVDGPSFFLLRLPAARD